MGVVRVNKNKNYTIMSNYHLNEKNMSLKAKGILSLMLSLPENWDYSINGLATLSKDGKDSVMSALNELEELGYLVRTKLVKSNGQFDGYDYDIYEKPNLDQPCSVKPNMDNQTQINTNIINNNKLKTNINKKEMIKENYFENDELNETFIEYLNLRKKLKAVNSDRAIKMLINELNNYDDDVKIKMLEQSIVNSWKSVYPLKNQNKKSETKEEWEHNLI